MKKLYTLLLLSMAIFAVACNNQSSAPASASDTHQGDPYETVSNIRYVNFDSIQQYYHLAQEVKTQIEALGLEYNQQANRYQNLLMQKENNIRQKTQQNLYLSEQSYNNDVAELNRLQNQYAQELAKIEQRASQQSMALQKMLSDSINNFIIDFNKTHQYDAILDRASGLYFNPALDITKEVIDGLNARYKNTGVALPADTTKTKK